MALVGSYARDAANEESDVDLIVLTYQPTLYIDDRSWANLFGQVTNKRVEDWGRVQSLRVTYGDDLEIEYGFALPDWADLPVDSGTRQVIRAGMRILFDRQGTLLELQHSVSGAPQK